MSFCELCYIKKSSFSMDDKVNMILERHNDIIKKAEKLYGKLPEIPVNFSSRLKRALGQYTYRINLKTDGIDKRQITYATLWVDKDFDELYMNTIPHEIAHFVCHIKNIGKNHDSSWKKVCLALGGNGLSCTKKTVNTYSMKCVCK